MKLPVCIFDLESDMLCPSCQSRLDAGQITNFDVEFSRWILDRATEYSEINKIVLLRAIRVNQRVILILKRGGKEILESVSSLIMEIRQNFGEPLIIEGPMKLRQIIRMLIFPATEVGVNSLYLPDGHKENIVVLRAEDEDRIPYTKSELRAIASAVVGESVLFEFQGERKSAPPVTTTDAFGEKLKEFNQKKT